MLDTDLDALGFRFFKMFSRFEYSLKAAGFHNGPGKAEPNWDKFAMSIIGKYNRNSDKTISSATEYIMRNPPKTQIIKDGKLDWEETKADGPDILKLLLYIRRVRNNLFHGGKFNGHWFAPERSEMLMKYAIVVLNACLQASNDLNDAYNN